MKKLQQNDFIAEVENDGSLYISADFDFNPEITFTLDANGDFYFDDRPPWIKNYFYYQDGK